MPLQPGHVENIELTVIDADQTVLLKLPQHLADMDRSESGGIGDMPLTKWKLESVATRQTALCELFEKTQDQAGKTLVGGAAAEVDGQSVSLFFFG